MSLTDNSLINKVMSSLARALFLLIFLQTSSSVVAQTYRILLSNDDGISSPLLHTLKQELAGLPGVEVVVSAPAENQSGSSHSTDGGPLIVERIYQDGELLGHSVAGKPSDAVRFGLVELGKDDPFDLVVSGINRGANVGNISHLSGTVGAAMEGLLHGVPAIAVSQDVADVDTVASARFTAQLVKHYRESGAPEGTLISINIPSGELQGVKIMPMGDSYLQTSHYELVEQTGERSVYERQRIVVQSLDPSTDTYAYQQGYITLTPLKFDWTDHDITERVESWNLQLVN